MEQKSLEVRDAGNRRGNAMHQFDICYNDGGERMRVERLVKKTVEGREKVEKEKNKSGLRRNQINRTERIMQGQSMMEMWLERG